MQRRQRRLRLSLRMVSGYFLLLLESVDRTHCSQCTIFTLKPGKSKSLDRIPLVVPRAILTQANFVVHKRTLAMTDYHRVACTYLFIADSSTLDSSTIATPTETGTTHQSIGESLSSCPLLSVKQIRTAWNCQRTYIQPVFSNRMHLKVTISRQCCQLLTVAEFLTSVAKTNPLLIQQLHVKRSELFYALSLQKQQKQPYSRVLLLKLCRPDMYRSRQEVSWHLLLLLKPVDRMHCSQCTVFSTKPRVPPYGTPSVDLHCSDSSKISKFTGRHHLWTTTTGSPAMFSLQTRQLLTVPLSPHRQTPLQLTHHRVSCQIAVVTFFSVRSNQFQL